MQVTIKTKDLKAVLPVVKKAMGKQSQVMILAGVLLTTAKNELLIEATDLETFLKVKLQAEIAEEGSVLIPFKTLEKLGSVCKEEDLTFKTTETEKERITQEWKPKKGGAEGEGEYIDVKEKYIEIKLKVYKLELEVMDKEEFPKREDLTGESIGNLDFSSFMEDLKKVNEFTKLAKNWNGASVLEGVLLNHNELVATDSYRLAVATLDFDLEKSIVIPKNAIEVLKPIEKIVSAEANFNITVEESKDSKEIDFNVSNEEYVFTVITRGLSGKFPEHKALIPSGEGAEWKYRVKSEGLIAIIDEGSKLLDLYKDNIPIRLSFLKESLQVNVEVREVGKYKSYVSTEALKVYNPEEFLIAFNSNFLITCLKNFSEPVLNLYDPLKPMLITEEGNNMKVIIMPVRVG